MFCRSKRCRAEIPDGSAYCPKCGFSQTVVKRRSIKRENGTGSIFKRADLKSRPWAAMTPASGGLPRQIIGYYPTAQEAKDALDDYRRHPTTKFNLTLKQLYEEWQPRGYKGKSKQLCDCYDAAWKNLKPLHDIKFREIRTAQMQNVIEDLQDERPRVGKDGNPLIKDGSPVMANPLGYSSLSKIKILLGLLYKYAMENDIVNKNYAEFLSLPKKGESAKERFTDIEKQKIEQSAGTIPFADCILMMCYTGFRVSEFLSLTPFNVHYHGNVAVLVGGEKTEAGKDRPVPVHPKIRPYLDAWLAKGGKTIICDEDGNPYKSDYFRTKIFKPTLGKIGVRILTPHATRRTFSTGMAAAGARPEDIIALMGHTDYAVDIDSYINQEVKTLYAAIAKLP